MHFPQACDGDTQLMASQGAVTQRGHPDETPLHVLTVIVKGMGKEILVSIKKHDERTAFLNPSLYAIFCNTKV